MAIIISAKGLYDEIYNEYNEEGRFLENFEIVF
jgi:hypothetical protein